jgi:hypothetical protein
MGTITAEPKELTLVDRAIAVFKRRLEADCENDFHSINRRIYWGYLQRDLVADFMLPVGEPKSMAEIEKLKSDWHSDPSWDIEDTEGFEAHRHELYVYRLESEKEWLNKRLNEYETAERVLRRILSSASAS